MHILPIKNKLINIQTFLINLYNPTVISQTRPCLQNLMEYFIHPLELENYEYFRSRFKFILLQLANVEVVKYHGSFNL